MPTWRVYVELETSSLADYIQLSAIAADLADEALTDAWPSSASLGSRYSMTATMTLAAAKPHAAQTLAATALLNVCASAGISTGKVLVCGLVPNHWPPPGRP